MNEADTYTILSQTFLTVLYASGPIMALALAVGLVIAFFQALTQIQEMTLTFVPKIVAIFLGLLVATPLAFAVLQRLSDRIFDMMVSGTV
ncbi:flagellar biosynthetic protein FliQ [Sulfitobacter sp. BDSS02]|uniref:flagellar biosynthetic protein FliQ n=1 Tax=Roseobacteraceae TaxID=2854170 RepID=UPI000B52471A|nr:MULTISPECIES: flagellar biosynthetic protein FliQ [Roseobacteraceae]MBL3704369.1 flagellar biosynthetic protein FliQ [Sulfitobacter sp. BDSS02]MBR9849654.1 flagellar biosynthetic protein FliQ [Paracoccaceae bacterium]OWU78149.1 flagellar biosynthesis protein FliQ [Phaeobacter sp. 22II1-1F12B]